ncbi:MAG: flagellar biosynthetic protein FliO [Gemmatimonadetes bacterium]|nr:flagellar biosynthetic protein FliO [Gemmatimonadota bacterium]
MALTAHILPLALLLQTADTSIAGAFPAGESNYMGMLFRMLLSLAAICVFIYFVGRYLMPRLFGMRTPGAGELTMIDQVPIGAGRAVCIVRAVGKYYLIGVAEKGVDLIAELDADEVRSRYKGETN